MAKFHILQVTDGEGTFAEVQGEAVVIKGIKAFVRNSNTTGSYLDCWAVTDLKAGVRLSEVRGTKNGAIRSAQERMEQRTTKTWLEDQAWFINEFGLSPSVPDPEIEIIQEPQQRGEIQICGGAKCGKMLRL